MESIHQRGKLHIYQQAHIIRMMIPTFRITVDGMVNISGEIHLILIPMRMDGISRTAQMSLVDGTVPLRARGQESNLIIKSGTIQRHPPPHGAVGQARVRSGGRITEAGDHLHLRGDLQ